MSPIPLMRFGVLEPFLRHVGALDERLLGEVEKAGLPLQLLSDPDELIPAERALHVVETFTCKLGQEGLGWSVGQESSLADLGTFGRRVLGAPTLYAALSCATSEFRRLNSAAMLDFEVRNGMVWLRHFMDGRQSRAVDQGHQYALSMLLDLIRRYGGDDWRPYETRLPSHLLACLPAEAAERVRLKASSEVGEAALAFDPALLFRPQERRAPDAWVGLSWDGKPNLSDDFVETVERVITSMFGSGRITAGRVAETGQMSVRSFHRELAGYGVTFGDLLNRLKFRKAHDLLATSPMKIGEIADVLGYAEQSNFNHAFRRWTGVSPGFYREQMLGRDAG